MKYVLTVFLLYFCSVAQSAPPKVGGPFKAAPGEVIEVEIEQDPAGKIGFHNPYDVENLYIREAVPRREKTLCLIVQPKKPGVYRLTLWTVNEAVGTTLVVDASGGITPAPPTPVPPDPPPPKPPEPVPPVPVTSFRVIFVYESGDNLTAAQKGVVFGKAVEDYMTATCTGGKNGWRRRDKDAPNETDPSMKAVWGAVRGEFQPPKSTPTPAVAIQVNEKVTIEPLPATQADTIALFKKYNGGK